jgi:hypothetical protein
MKTRSRLIDCAAACRHRLLRCGELPWKTPTTAVGAGGRWESRTRTKSEERMEDGNRHLSLSLLPTPPLRGNGIYTSSLSPCEERVGRKSRRNGQLDKIASSPRPSPPSCVRRRGGSTLRFQRFLGCVDTNGCAERGKTREFASALWRLRFGRAAGFRGQTRLNSLKLARTLILNFFKYEMVSGAWCLT